MGLIIMLGRWYDFDSMRNRTVVHGPHGTARWVVESGSDGYAAIRINGGILHRKIRVPHWTESYFATASLLAIKRFNQNCIRGCEIFSFLHNEPAA